MRLALALGLSILPLVFVGCLSNANRDSSDVEPVAPSVDERWTPARWKAALSQEIYDAVVFSIEYIDAPDGTRLSLTLHLPEGMAEGTRIPTLLQITPYQAGRQDTPAGGGAQAAPPWREFVIRGAAYVEADARGTNGSEGCLDFGGTKDREDAAAFVAWIRAQPWSNGVVVTDGISHPGMGSVVAHAAVPDLTAALAHAPVVSYYQDEWLQGAKFEDQFNGPFYQTTDLDPALYLSAEALQAQAAPCTGDTVLDFGPVDGPFGPLWADRDLSRHPDIAQAPILLTHGFVDLNVHPDHSQLYWDALPDDFPKYAVFGWWYHGWPDLTGHPSTAEPPQTFHDLRQRWLDATLFGIDNGLWDEPRVLVEDSRGTWHEGTDWPLEPSEWVTFHPAEDGSLSNDAAADGSVSYTDRLGAERGVWAEASAVFRTEPLAGDRLINGAPQVDLVASSSEAATKWVAYLIDEAPDGSWERVSHGYADSHTHGDEAQWLPMTAGTTYEWTLHLMPTAVVVEAGHRLVLVIASQDSDLQSGYDGTRACFDDHRGGCYSPSGIVPADSVGRAVNTVELGPDGTQVRLAWVDPLVTQKVPWPA